MKTQKCKLNVTKFPIILEVFSKGLRIGEYVLKLSKDKTGVFLNKKESY